MCLNLLWAETWCSQHFSKSGIHKCTPRQTTSSVLAAWSSRHISASTSSPWLVREPIKRINSDMFSLRWKRSSGIEVFALLLGQLGLRVVRVCILPATVLPCALQLIKGPCIRLVWRTLSLQPLVEDAILFDILPAHVLATNRIPRALNKVCPLRCPSRTGCQNAVRTVVCCEGILTAIWIRQSVACRNIPELLRVLVIEGQPLVREHSGVAAHAAAAEQLLGDLYRRKKRVAGLARYTGLTRDAFTDSVAEKHPKI